MTMMIIDDDADDAENLKFYRAMKMMKRAHFKKTKRFLHSMTFLLNAMENSGVDDFLNVTQMTL